MIEAGGASSLRRPMTDGNDASEMRRRLYEQGSRLALAILTALAIASRPLRELRRLLRLKPRSVWGPQSLINIKYWSAGLRAAGYPSFTLVSFVSPINSRSDFDRHFDDFLGTSLVSILAKPFVIFAYLLFKADVVLAFMNGGFLATTPMRHLEGGLLRLAGIKMVSFPYGADIAVPGYIGAAEEPLLKDYPEFRDTADQTRRRVNWFCHWSTVVVRNYQFGYVPRWDVRWPTCLAIDTDEWSCGRPATDADGENGEVVVLHAPNHRHVKGTDELMRAIAELQREGLKVRLNLLERRPNTEIQQAMMEADVVADQFHAGYAMFAIEGLAMGKPVLSALSGMPQEIRASRALASCPIVDTNIENLKENLRKLVREPERRRELGEAGRRFALDYHSLPAVTRCWEIILEHAWRGASLPRELPPPGHREH